LRPSRAGTRPRASVATIRHELLDRLLIVNQQHAAAVLHADAVGPGWHDRDDIWA
jgi:hypothetical protein